MQEEFPDDVASTVGNFIAYLAKNGVVEPHLECHSFTMNFTKDDKDQVTRCTLSIDNVDPCTVSVRMQAANANPEFDNLGSSLVLGDDDASWDLITRKHSKGYLAIQDRMVYNESPKLGGLAPLKYGVWLDKTIRIKKDALRKLA